MNGLYGIIISGKVYELSERGCMNCDLFDLCERESAIFCQGFPYPNPEKDNCFRFSQSLTEKLSNYGNQQEDSSAGV